MSFLNRLSGNEKLLIEVERQLEKDLGNLWSSKLFQKNISSENIQRTLVQVVENQLKTAPSRLLNMCYRIDLPEGKVMPLLRSPSLTELAKSQELALLILNRTIQKVWTRLSYLEN